jgi:RNA processing factor Prp31
MDKSNSFNILNKPNTNTKEVLQQKHSELKKAVKVVEKDYKKVINEMSEDEWNKETGCMIAFSRAKDKCYKSFFKRANTFVQTVDRRLGDMIEMFNDFGMKLENKREALQNEIDDRINVKVEEE